MSAASSSYACHRCRWLRLQFHPGSRRGVLFLRHIALSRKRSSDALFHRYSRVTRLARSPRHSHLYRLAQHRRSSRRVRLARGCTVLSRLTARSNGSVLSGVAARSRSSVPSGNAARFRLGTLTRRGSLAGSALSRARLAPPAGTLHMRGSLHIARYSRCSRLARGNSALSQAHGSLSADRCTLELRLARPDRVLSSATARSAGTAPSPNTARSLLIGTLPLHGYVLGQFGGAM